MAFTLSVHIFLPRFILLDFTFSQPIVIAFFIIRMYNFIMMKRLYSFLTAGILYFVLLLFLGGCSELSPVETGDAERGASESDTPVIAKTDYSNTGLRISEAMSKNRAALPDANGLFPD